MRSDGVTGFPPLDLTLINRSLKDYAKGVCLFLRSFGNVFSIYSFRYGVDKTHYNILFIKHVFPIFLRPTGT